MADATEKLFALKKAYHEVFTSEAGKVVLKDLERVSFISHSTIHENPHITYFNEGQRSLVLHIISRMNLENVLNQIKEEESLNV